jgi:hypothetical protein
MPHSCGKPHFPRLRRDTHQEERMSATHRPSHDEIARLAFSYWEERGRQGGSATEDWQRAERALRA